MFSKKAKAENSRREKRFQAHYLLKYKVQGSEAEPFITNIRDLSSGGLRFWAEKFLPEGTLLQLDFLLPALEREIHAEGCIVRVRQAENSGIFYVAVRFSRISAEDQKALGEWIEKLSQDRDGRKFIYDETTVKRNAPFGNLYDE